MIDFEYLHWKCKAPGCYRLTVDGWWADVELTYTQGWMNSPGKWQAVVLATNSKHPRYAIEELAIEHICK